MYTLRGKALHRQRQGRHRKMISTMAQLKNCCLGGSRARHTLRLPRVRQTPIKSLYFSSFSLPSILFKAIIFISRYLFSNLIIERINTFTRITSIHNRVGSYGIRNFRKKEKISFLGKLPLKIKKQLESPLTHSRTKKYNRNRKLGRTDFDFLGNLSKKRHFDSPQEGGKNAIENVS